MNPTWHDFRCFLIALLAMVLILGLGNKSRGAQPVDGGNWKAIGTDKTAVSAPTMRETTAGDWQFLANMMGREGQNQEEPAIQPTWTPIHHVHADSFSGMRRGLWIETTDPETAIRCNECWPGMPWTATTSLPRIEILEDCGDGRLKKRVTNSGGTWEDWDYLENPVGIR